MTILLDRSAIPLRPSPPPPKSQAGEAYRGIAIEQNQRRGLIVRLAASLLPPLKRAGFHAQPVRRRRARHVQPLSRRADHSVVYLRKREGLNAMGPKRDPALTMRSHGPSMRRPVRALGCGSCCKRRASLSEPPTSTRTPEQRPAGQSGGILVGFALLLFRCDVDRAFGARSVPVSDRRRFGGLSQFASQIGFRAEPLAVNR